jgi:hypothetical protein
VELLDQTNHQEKNLIPLFIYNALVRIFDLGKSASTPSKRQHAEPIDSNGSSAAFDSGLRFSLCNRSTANPAATPAPPKNIRAVTGVH